jgi:hypothetical protein
MYVYERFNGILKSFVRNQAYPEGSMVQGYCTEEDVEWALNYADPSNPIGVPKSRHEGRLIGKATIGKKAITPDSHLFRCAHFHMLQQMSISSEYFNEHKEVLLRDNLSYAVFMPKPSTHRMHDPGSNVPHIRPKEFTENQMSQYKV